MQRETTLSWLHFSPIFGPGGVSGQLHHYYLFLHVYYRRYYLLDHQYSLHYYTLITPILHIIITTSVIT